jgi:hypothetical protein
VPSSRRRKSAQSALSSLRRALASPAKAGLPGSLAPAVMPRTVDPNGDQPSRPRRDRPAALIGGTVLAAALAVAPAHASQAPAHPAVAQDGVINADGIQGTGA